MLHIIKEYLGAIHAMTNHQVTGSLAIKIILSTSSARAELQCGASMRNFNAELDIYIVGKGFTLNLTTHTPDFSLFIHS